MKFQCGMCGKYYLIEHADQISSQQKLRCPDCGNIFMFQKDLAFSSASKNSKRICEQCDSLVHEESGTCLSCIPALKRLPEECRLDNRVYTHFEVRRGKIRPKHGRRQVGKAVLLAGLSVLVMASLVLFLPGSKRDALKRAVLKPLGIKTRTETQVIILRSGAALYADKVEHDGTKVRITGKDGKVLTIGEEELAYESKAVIED
ncbi:hypothetical protein [Candidatus Electronema sp. PJ]|uniref:hypothetical protein n=1 Tax=Candidatus Electronema sp. PJ TaxID=3401572 RepID=UPI003AA7D7EC